MLLNVLGDFGATCKVELAKGPVLLVLSLLSNMFGGDFGLAMGDGPMPSSPEIPSKTGLLKQ